MHHLPNSTRNGPNSKNSEKKKNSRDRNSFLEILNWINILLTLLLLFLRNYLEKRFYGLTSKPFTGLWGWLNILSFVMDSKLVYIQPPILIHFVTWGKWPNIYTSFLNCKMGILLTAFSPHAFFQELNETSIWPTSFWQTLTW